MVFVVLQIFLGGDKASNIYCSSRVLPYHLLRPIRLSHILCHSPDPDTVWFEGFLNQKFLAIIGIVDGFSVEEPIDHTLDTLSSFDDTILTITLAVGFIDTAPFVRQLVIRAQHGGDWSDILRWPEGRDSGRCHGRVNICWTNAVDGNIVGGQQRADCPRQCQNSMLGRIVQWSQGKWVQTGAGRCYDQFRVECRMWSVGS